MCTVYHEYMYMYTATRLLGLKKLKMQSLVVTLNQLPHPSKMNKINHIIIYFDLTPPPPPDIFLRPLHTCNPGGGGGVRFNKIYYISCLENCTIFGSSGFSLSLIYVHNSDERRHFNEPAKYIGPTCTCIHKISWLVNNWLENTMYLERSATLFRCFSYLPLH